MPVIETPDSSRVSAIEPGQFFDLSPEPLAVVSAIDGSWRRANPALCGILGWSEDELRGMLPFSLIHPDDVARTKQALADLSAGKKIAEFEQRVRCRDGAFRSLVWKATADAGDNVYLAGRDLTGRTLDVEAAWLAARRDLFRVALADALRPLTDPLEIQDVASRVLGEHLGVNRAFYVEVHNGDYVLVGHFAQDVPLMPPGRYRAEDYGKGVIEAFQAGRSVVVEDTELNEQFTSAEREAYAAIAVRAYAAVPLLKAGRLVALMGMHQRTPRAWTAEELSLMEETAERTWAAVEQARAEQRLRESEERYLALFNAIEQGFCTLEVRFDEDDRPVDYRFLEVSPSFERQTGIPNAAGRWMREIAPDQDEHWFEIYGGVALTGDPVRFESHSTPLGRWWSVYAFRIQEPALRRVGVLFYDITDRKQAEKELRASEERYRSLFESIDEGFCVVELLFDAEGKPEDYRLLQMNPAFEQLTGLRGAHGRSMRDLIPDLAGSWMETFAHVNRTGEARRIVNESHSTGRWFTVYAFPIGAPEDHQVAVLFSDITDQKRAEADLRAASVLKDEFLGLVSHELRTPLTIIRGNAFILGRTADLKDESLRDALRDLMTETERLTRIVENMLVLGRMEAGKKPPIEPVLVTRALREAVRQFRKENAEDDVSIAEAPENAIVFGVEEYIEQILNNLLSNAHKYSARGSPITVSAQVEGDRVRFSVADRGRGVSNPELVFAAFYRESDFNAVAPGLGLGLAVARRLTEAQGGEIRVEAREGGGSVFAFTLPLAGIDADES